MNVQLEISKDGFIHCGQNSWWPLTALEAGQSKDGTVLVKGSWVRYSDIEKAVSQQMSALQEQVLQVVQPGYAEAREDCAGRMEHRVQPSLSRCDENRIAEALAMNCREEALPLPSTMVRNVEAKYEAASHSDDGESLPLPSTMRRVEQKQTAPTINRQCPQCQEHLVMPSTMRKVS